MFKVYNDSRIVKRFREEVERFGLQTHEERRALAAQRTRKPHGDVLRPLLPQEQVLVRDNLRLVFQVGRRYQDDSVMPFSDLLQEGVIGLMFAAENWDPRLGTFSTYATIRISTAMRNAVSDARHSQGLRIPSGAITQHLQLQELQAKLAQEYGREPTADEILERSEISERRFRQLHQLPRGQSTERALRFRSATKFENGLAEETSDHRDNHLANTLADDVKTPEELASDVELGETMCKLLATLTPREEFVLRHRYGLVGDGEEEKTLPEVGALLDVTYERIRQIESKALRKFRHHSRSRRLRSFVAY